MSYSGPRYPLGALGEKYVGGGAEGSLEGEESRHGRNWRFKGIKAGQDLEALIRELQGPPVAARGEFEPAVPLAHPDGSSTWSARAGQDPEFSEEYPPLTNLKMLWIRMGRANSLWPGAQGEYNFGPTTYVDANQNVAGTYNSYDVKKPANALRMNTEFLELLGEHAGRPRSHRVTVGGMGFTGPYSDRLWVVHNDGYVRLRKDDPLLEAVRARLVRDGYLAPTSQVSTKDDSAFVRALKTRVRQENAESGRNRGGVGNKYFWPSDTDLGSDSALNFGPNTNGNEIRIHPDVLLRALIAPSPDARKAAAAALRGMKVSRPVLGTLPPVSGGKPTPVGVIPARRAAVRAAVTASTGPRLMESASETRERLRRMMGS